MPLTPRIRLTLALLLAIGLVPAFAHEVPVEHVVDMVIEPRAADLVVRVHLPVAVVSGATAVTPNAPVPDGALSPDRLRLVAADFAHNLELQQGDVVLPAAVESATPGADGAAVDVQLRYLNAGADEPISVRINAFRTVGASVRTNVRYRLPSGGDHVVSVTGPSERITLNPTFGEVVQQFVGRGVRTLLNGGDHLLFLLCVLLPIRRARSALTLFAAAGLGQALAIGLSLLIPAAIESSVDVLVTVAASVVVVAALQNIVRARERLVLALTLTFGLLNGVAFGHEFVVAAPFAWSHAAVAALVFAGTVLVGELWLGALAWATRTWLDERGVPERVLAVLASAVIIHTAAHRLVERGQIVARAGAFGAERVLVAITLAWIAVMLGVAVTNAVSARGRDAGAAMPGATGAEAS